jgi:hypothetical protein
LEAVGIDGRGREGMRAIAFWLRIDLLNFCKFIKDNKGLLSLM